MRVEPERSLAEMIEGITREAPLSGEFVKEHKAKVKKKKSLLSVLFVLLFGTALTAVLFPTTRWPYTLEGVFLTLATAVSICGLALTWCSQWRIYEYKKYPGKVPPHVREIAEELKQKIQGVYLYVDAFDSDPFLVANDDRCEEEYVLLF